MSSILVEIVNIFLVYIFPHFAYFRETEEPVVETENTSAEKPSGEENAADANKENPVNEQEEKEPEEKVHIYLSLSGIPVCFGLQF